MCIVVGTCKHRRLSMPRHTFTNDIQTYHCVDICMLRHKRIYVCTRPSITPRTNSNKEKATMIKPKQAPSYGQLNTWACISVHTANTHMDFTDGHTFSLGCLRQLPCRSKGQAGPRASLRPRAGGTIGFHHHRCRRRCHCRSEGSRVAAALARRTARSVMV